MLNLNSPLNQRFSQSRYVTMLAHYRTALSCLLLVLESACTGGGAPSTTTPPPVLGDGFASLEVAGPQSLLLHLQRPADAKTVAAGGFALVDYTSVPPVRSSILTASTEDPFDIVTLNTAPLLAGTTYTLVVTGMRDQDGTMLEGTLNFTAIGGGPRIPVTVVVSDVEKARGWEGLQVLASVNPETGGFSEERVAYELIDEGDRFSVVLEPQLDPNRTLSTSDDGDLRVDRRGYALMLVDRFGRVASALTPFEVGTAPSEVPVQVLVPPEVVVPVPEDVLPDPPLDDAPTDGVKLVRVIVDDKAASELTAPQLKLSFDDAGTFDASFPQTVSLTPLPGEDKGFWEAVIKIAVDPNRVADGATTETFPYFAFLIEAGVEYEGISAALLAPDETPQTVRLSLGRPDWTPVTFRVDVGGAFLSADGSARGIYPGEAVFLTGEWQQAVDALGRNCGDAFSGGEQPNLKMRELSQAPGVWTRTIWLPPGRPYGWKVVRCDAAEGCGPLNQIVASAGRAFATVMKNLVTDNVDAFADPNVGLIDPLDLQNVQAGSQTLDYSNAQVFVGDGVGSESDPAGTPDGQRMFKQEAPDLVVIVDQTPLVTRVFHVGTWRDVNIGRTPTEIIADNTTVQLTIFDYDDGFIGRYPPSRENP